MVDEIRNDDPAPGDEEPRWIGVEPVSAVIGLMVLATLALAISVSMATITDAPHKPAKSVAAK